MIRIDSRDKKRWFLGCIVKYDRERPDLAEVDHLVRCTEGNEQWKYPENPDICEVDVRQLVSVKPDYEWEIHSPYQKLALRIIEKL